MNIVKPLAIVAVGISMALASGPSAFAKGHDMGKADGTRIDPSALRGGVVAGQDTDGIGAAAFGGFCDAGFCGVVDPDGDLTYGRAIVTQQREAGIRRVTPVVNGRK